LQLSAAPEEGPLVVPLGRGGYRLGGVLVARGGDERTIQVAWTEPA
jgi:hypothetical protein